MDAHAYLKSQGWRGTGHSLHPDSDETGLKHHLLIKRNDDGRGLGLKKADHKAEAWWLNAFDQALKGIDVSKDAKGGMKQTLRDGGQLAKITSKGLTKYTGSRGLYNSFVKGGVIGGSVGVDELTKPGITLGGSRKKEAGSKSERKTQLVTPPDSGAATPTLNDDDDSSSSSEDDSDVQKAAKTKRKAAKKERKQQKVTEKAERRARREAKKLDKAREPGQDDKKALRKAAKKAEKKAAKALMKASETREQRKARRDVRRDRKEEKRKITALR